MGAARGGGAGGRARVVTAHLRHICAVGSPAGNGLSGRCSTARDRGRWTGRTPPAATTPTPRAPNGPSCRRELTREPRAGAAPLGRLFLGAPVSAPAHALGHQTACSSFFYVIQTHTAMLEMHLNKRPLSRKASLQRTFQPRVGQRAPPAAGGQQSACRLPAAEADEGLFRPARFQDGGGAASAAPGNTGRGGRGRREGCCERRWAACRRW